MRLSGFDYSWPMFHMATPSACPGGGRFRPPSCSKDPATGLCFPVLAPVPPRMFFKWRIAIDGM